MYLADPQNVLVLETYPKNIYIGLEWNEETDELNQGMDGWMRGGQWETEGKKQNEPQSMARCEHSTLQYLSTAATVAQKSV